MKRSKYFLIHRPGEPPKEGWRTLFVLPGGSGGADFRTFVTAMTKFALPDGYQTVQLIAPVWDAKQAQDMVWPTDKLKTASVKFSTRDFFLALRAEVEKSQRIDPRYVFTLTWSSSGPNGYLLSLDPKAGITGSFIAMSVFQPAQLPSLQTAKGRPYFLYHSPADFIPFAQAEAARDALRKAGAAVELVSYPGGHGWTGETMADIRKGITWLEEHVAPGACEVKHPPPPQPGAFDLVKKPRGIKPPQMPAQNVKSAAAGEQSQTESGGKWYRLLPFRWGCDS
jgi:predicted esterase